MDNEQLQSLVEKISIDFFKKKFRHQAIFNGRLRTTGGRYVLATGNIEINKKYYEAYGMNELIGIIKHELCHYHLHQNNMGYKHKDKEFKELAKQVGAPTYCTPLPHAQKKNHIYECIECHLVYRRIRKVNTKRYVCGKCGGKLKEIDEK